MSFGKAHRFDESNDVDFLIKFGPCLCEQSFFFVQLASALENFKVEKPAEFLTAAARLSHVESTFSV